MYDHAIIFPCHEMFVTSDMQFGFEDNHSNVM